ncbi:unnamed protein product, partial [Urochloa humidicola]
NPTTLTAPAATRTRPHPTSNLFLSLLLPHPSPVPVSKGFHSLPLRAAAGAGDDPEPPNPPEHFAAMTPTRPQGAAGARLERSCTSGSTPSRTASPAALSFFNHEEEPYMMDAAQNTLGHSTDEMTVVQQSPSKNNAFVLIQLIKMGVRCPRSWDKTILCMQFSAPFLLFFFAIQCPPLQSVAIQCYRLIMPHVLLS